MTPSAQSPVPDDEPSERCPRCGAPRRSLRAVPCAACLARDVLMPGPEQTSEDFAQNGGAQPHETWAPVFPHLKLEGTSESVGSGLQGFRARDLEADRAVWLVVIDEACVNTRGGPDAWRQSYRALQQLNHAHLAAVRDFGDLGERFYIIFEALEGEALDALMPSLDAPTLEKFIRQVEDGVMSARIFGVSLSFRFQGITVVDHRRAVLLPLLDPASEEAVQERAGSPRALETGSRVGAYTVIDKMGEGGFAEVWLAEQEEPVKRRVALKVIKEGMDTQRVLARFEAERQALALLQHPYIARVFDAGCTDAGRPYFVMEAVDGEPIDRYCRRTQASLETRLRLVKAICEAVQHAHQKGIIHRDLKPTNLLVVEETPGKPAPRVIDFGIAKAIDQKLGHATLFTQDHHLLGTPEYMSPEQATRGRASIDSRSDVYALGVILYELITGSVPFAKDPESGNQARRDREAVKPSTRLVSAHREGKGSVSWTDHRGRVPPELDWIVLKALERDPERRYASPAQLAEDIERFLKNEAIMAGPPTRTYQIRKFVQRHRLSVVSAAAGVLALVAGSGLAFWGWMQADAERKDALAAREEAQQSARVAEAVNAFLRDDLLGSANPKVTGKEAQITLREAVDRAATMVEDRFGDEPEVLASLHFTLAETYRGLTRNEEAEHHARRAAAVMETVYGRDHLKAIGTRSLVAQALKDASKFGEALAWNRDVLIDKENVLGAEHASTLRTRRRIAGLLGQLGRYEEAEQALRELLVIQERSLGREHEDTLNTETELARQLFEQGAPEKQREAIDLMRQQLEDAEARLGPDDDETVGNVNALAVMLSQTGEAEEAERLHRRALRQNEAVFGEAHGQTLTSMANLALTLNQLQRHDEAIELLRRVVGLRKEHFQSGDLGTLAALHNLASALYQQGHVEEALPHFQEVVDVGSIVLGENHPKILTAKGYMAKCQMDLGKVDAGLSLLEEVASATEAAVGRRHPAALAADHNLAFYLGKAGRQDEANVVWEEVCETAEALYVAEDVRLAEHLNVYAESLRDNGQHLRSVPLFQRVYSINLQAFGEDHRDTKWAKVQWLTSKKQAGEKQSPEEAEEVERLFKEVEGRDIWEVYREIQAGKIRVEEEDTTDTPDKR